MFSMWRHWPHGEDLHLTPAPKGGRGGGRGGRSRGIAFLAPVAARGGLQGTVLHDGLPCKVLFDTGASHSFISWHFCMSRGIMISEVNRLLSVGTPTGVSVDLHEVVKDYEVMFLSRVFRIDLFVLGFQGFDVILGMDWMKENSIKLDMKTFKFKSARQSRTVQVIRVKFHQFLPHSTENQEEKVCSKPFPSFPVNWMKQSHLVMERRLKDLRKLF